MTRKKEDKDLVETVVQDEIVEAVETKVEKAPEKLAKLVNRSNEDLFIKYDGSQIKLHSFGEFQVFKSKLEENLPNGVYLIS